MLRILFFIGTALVCVACGGEDPEEARDPVCEAGRVEACACPGGAEGAQACADDGSKWGECECENPGPDGGGGGPRTPMVRDPCTTDRDCDANGPAIYENALWCIESMCIPAEWFASCEEADELASCSGQDGYCHQEVYCLHFT